MFLFKYCLYFYHVNLFLNELCHIEFHKSPALQDSYFFFKSKIFSFVPVLIELLLDYEEKEIANVHKLI